MPVLRYLPRLAVSCLNPLSLSPTLLSLVPLPRFDVERAKERDSDRSVGERRDEGIKELIAKHKQGTESAQTNPSNNRLGALFVPLAINSQRFAHILSPISFPCPLPFLCRISRQIKDKGRAGTRERKEIGTGICLSERKSESIIKNKIINPKISEANRAQRL